MSRSAGFLRLTPPGPGALVSRNNAPLCKIGEKVGGARPWSRESGQISAVNSARASR